LVLLTAIVTVLAVQAGPVMADDDVRCHERNNGTTACHERDDDGDNDADDVDFDFEDEVLLSDLFFFPFVSEVDVDVDEENVGPRNDREGDCIVTGVDLDLDGLIAEWEIEVTCFV